MAYRREDIERVRAATDLVELIAEVTKVKKGGRSSMAICPFHQEKTPSMSVDGARGLYNCFGCGKSGDLFRWVQDTQGLDFTEAVELLARRAGITLQQDPGASRRRGQREAMIDAVEKSVGFFEERLRSAPDAGPARAYLRSRGYGAETVDRFHLGYSPDSWDALVHYLRRLDIPEKVILTAGLAVRSRQGRLVDRFRGRLMFPIYDLRGDAVGFGARILDGDGPKYLNSPETPLYHKSRLLYGLNWAKSAIVRAGEAVVVEGYTDVIGMHEAGMPVSVATCGTALGEEHFKLLLRFTDRVILAFDADAAGAGASVRGFEQSAPGEMDLRVAVLPAGRDPADLASARELDVLRKALDASDPLMQFRLDLELERFDLSEPEARARAIRATAALVARHPDPLARHEYAVLLARRTGVDLSAVERAVDAAFRHRAVPAREQPEQAARKLTGQEKAERELLRLMLANDPGLRSIEIDDSAFTDEVHSAAYELLHPAVAALEPGEPPDLGALLGDIDTPAGHLLRSLALNERPLPEAAELAEKVRIGALDRRIQALRRVVDALDPEREPEDYSTRFAELIALERRRRAVGGPS